MNWLSNRSYLFQVVVPIILAWYIRWTYPIISPMILAEFGLSYALLGLVSTLTLLGATVGYMIMGRLARGLSPRTILQLGASTFLVAAFASATVYQFFQLVVLQVAIGFAEALVYMSLLMLAIDRFGSHNTGKLTGGLEFGAMIGGSIALGLGGVVASTYGWRGAYFFATLFGLTLLILSVRSSSGRKQTRGSDRAISDGAAGQSSLVYILPAAIWSLGSSAFWAFIPVFLVDARSLVLESAGLVTAVSRLAAAFFPLVGGIIADRKNSTGLVAISMFLFALCNISLPRVNDLIHIVLLALVGGGLQATTLVALISLVEAKNPGKATYGQLLSATYVGLIIGPYVFGFIVDVASFADAFLYISGTSIAAVVVLVLLDKFHP